MNEIIEQVIAHANETQPNECCGLVVERNGAREYVRCTNISGDPLNQFVIDPEEYAYPNGGMHRRARVLFNGKLRMARAGIPDTYFSIPARCGNVAGWIGIDDGALVFHANKAQA